MLPKTHILFGAIFSIILYLLFQITPFQATIIFFASVLIDFDHYMLYALNKNLSLKKAFNYHKNLPKNHKPIMHIFHTIEFSLLIILIYFLISNPPLKSLILFTLIGMLFHTSLDLIDIQYNKKWNCREFSLIRYLQLRNKHPDKYLNNKY